MGLVPAICTQCGAKINVDASKDAGICEFCGTAFVTEKAINNYTTINQNNYNGAIINNYGVQNNATEINNLIKLYNNAKRVNNYNKARQILNDILSIDKSNEFAWAEKFEYVIYDIKNSIDDITIKDCLIPYYETVLNAISFIPDKAIVFKEYYDKEIIAKLDYIYNDINDKIQKNEFMNNSIIDKINDMNKYIFIQTTIDKEIEKFTELYNISEIKRKEYKKQYILSMEVNYAENLKSLTSVLIYFCVVAAIVIIPISIGIFEYDKIKGTIVFFTWLFTLMAIIICHNKNKKRLKQAKQKKHDKD